MSKPEAGQGAPAPARVQLMVDLGACLTEWQRATSQGARPVHPNMAWLRGFSVELERRVGGMGFGGLAHHLGELVRRADSNGAAGDVREPLRALFHFAEQARQSLTAHEQELLARGQRRSAPPAPAHGPVQAAVRAPAPPPAAVWAPAAGLVVPQAASSPPEQAMSSGRSRGAASALNPMASANAARPPAAPVAASGPPMRAMNAAESAEPPAGGPGLLRTMFGLRAFSVRPPESARASAARDSAPLLGLQRRSTARFPLMSDNAGARKVQDLMGRIGRARIGSQTDPAHVRSTVSPKAQQKIRAWRVGAIVGAAVVLAVVATLIIVFTRSADEADRARVAAAAASKKATQAKAEPTLAEMPQTRLLDADETFRALLTQVHGRGTESPELRALVDEQAALAARKCEGTSAACQEWAKIRESLSGGPVRRVPRRRVSGSLDRINSGWMLGLKLPQIPVENDSRVQRKFEYYTVGTVGRELFQAMLFRCGAYRDLIESTLIRYGLPVDLMAVVFTESGCEPQAVSPVGAAGLWQFMPETARAYHLRVKEGVIDERRSPPKSTEAAVRFLRDLHDKMVVYNKEGVWDLVFGAFNLGPFGMAARAERTGGDVGFWDLVDAEMLPDETVQYAPTVQAVALILNNLQKLKFAGVQMRSPQLTSDLEVPAGTRLSLIARAASTSVNQIRSMNLDISGDRTPALPNFAVQVPKDVVFQAGDTLKALMAAKDNSDLCVTPSFDWGRQLFTDEMATACKRKLRVRKPASK